MKRKGRRRVAYRAADVAPARLSAPPYTVDGQMLWACSALRLKCQARPRAAWRSGSCFLASKRQESTSSLRVRATAPARLGESARARVVAQGAPMRDRRTLVRLLLLGADQSALERFESLVVILFVEHLGLIGNAEQDVVSDV